jgi:NAD(P)-dependent dehydrogenase (short-subunit alcohol dehydrogenase family)
MSANRAVQGTALAVGAIGLIRAIARRRRRIEFTDRTVLIAGGSRGLGLALARELCDEGADLVLVARSPGDLVEAQRELSERSGRPVMAIPADLTRPGEVEGVVQHAMARYGRIDVLVNCAGVIQVGPIDHMALHDFEQALATHLWAPLFMMNAVVPIMRDQGGGRVVNISSIGGKVAPPHLAPYVASKFALVGLSDALRAELAPHGIRVTTVCPGLMRTGSHFNITVKGRHREEFAWFAISDALPLLSMNVRRAARQIIHACRYGDARLTVGLAAKLAVAADALAPGLVADAMALAHRFLPAPTDQSGDTPRTGWISQSRWAPSLLTRLADRAVAENNELRGRPPDALIPDPARSR